METLFDGRRRKDDLRRVAGLAVKQGQQIALFNLGREAGGRAAALYVDNDQGNFRHDGQPHEFRFKGDARSGSDGHCRFSGIGGTDGETDRGNLVLGLVHHASRPIDALGQVVRG